MFRKFFKEPQINYQFVRAVTEFKAVSDFLLYSFINYKKKVAFVLSIQPSLL